MAYERPKGLHEATYTNGELVILVYRQLYLLRSAIFRTVTDLNYYPELFRALRVLVIDGNRGRLGDLARKTELHHGVPSMQSAVPVGEGRPPRSGPDAWRWFRERNTATVFVNPCSRWLRLRGEQLKPPAPCIETDFWVYLEAEIVSSKPEYGAPITRAMLIAEVCNTLDVVHATFNYPTFLVGAQSWGHTCPYFIEIAQEVAFEVLIFGQQVLDAASEKYRDQVELALRKGIPIGPAGCPRCHLPLSSLADFVCPRCKQDMLPPPPKLPLVKRLSSIFRQTNAADQTEGTVEVCMDLSILHSNPVADIPLVRDATSTSWVRITRTASMRLTWEMSTNGLEREVSWDVSDSPTEGDGMFLFRWSSDDMSIVSVTANGELMEVTASGARRPVTASE